MEEFDFIVTGAGSAGCVLANRLSASGKHKVLLLEAGGKDSSFWIHVPMGYAKTFVDPKVNWMFESEPEERLNNRTMYQPRGKVLGGTSSINGMIYMRGHAADYDQWRQLGNEGWDYDSVLPYFRKAEDNERGASEFHGAGGPLRVSNQPYEWEIGKALLEACKQAGIPETPDFNGAKQEGCGYYQTTTNNKRRWSTAAALSQSGALEAQPEDRNPRARHQGAGRERPRGRRGMAIAGRTAKPRAPAARSSCQAARSARRICCNCPASDPASICGTWASTWCIELPGVGSNLQDHFNTFCTYRIARNLSLNSLQYSFANRMVAGARYVLLRNGPMTGNGLYVGALVRTDPRFERPDLQMNISAWSTVERDTQRHHFASASGDLDQPGASAARGARHGPAEVERSVRAAAHSFRLHEVRLRHAGDAVRDPAGASDRPPAGDAEAAGRGNLARHQGPYR